MNIRDKRGITLIEAIIYIAIIGIVLTGFINFSLSNSLNREKVFVISEVNSNIRTSIELIQSRVFGADSIDFNNSILDTDPGLIYLNYTDIAKNPTIITLDQDNGSLLIKEGNNATTTVTNDKVIISNLTFSDFTKVGTRDTVRIELSVDYNNTLNDVIYNYSKDLVTTLQLKK
jgi:type II secretory pathway pseudopilin PulG